MRRRLRAVTPQGQAELELRPRDQHWSRRQFRRRSCSGALPEPIVRLEDEPGGGSLEDVPGNQGSDGALRVGVLEIEALRDLPGGAGPRHPKNEQYYS